MITLREAAQQALEAMQYATPTGKITLTDWYKSITALKAALAESPTWVCPDSAEHRYQKPGHCEDCGKTLVQVAESPDSTKPVAESEPVAKVIATAPKQIWLDLGFDPADEDVTFDQLFEATWSQDNATGWGIEYIRADLAAPPQRKPLTEEEIQAIWAKTFESGSSANAFARAIERAHGIGGQDE